MTSARPGLAAWGIALASCLSVVTGCSPSEPPSGEGAATTGTAAPETPAPGPDDPRPNFVVVLLDDTGFADLGPYGSEIATPHIDALAAEGVKLTNFHVAPVGPPTRGMLLTGIDSHRAGLGNLREILAETQRGQPGYEGALGQGVVTVPTLLRDAGYHTYMAGKWDLGKGRESLPAARGFERSVAVMDGGADNWEQKSHRPQHPSPQVYEDFERVELPADFYSTRYYTDRLMEYIGEDRIDGRPFFAYLSLQAQHPPLQAPKDAIERHAGAYDAGWEEIRAARYARQVELGLVPEGLTLPPVSGAPSLESLSEEERRAHARRMAVYAAMLEQVDANLGRLLRALQELGEREETVVVLLSASGPNGGVGEASLAEWHASNSDLSTERMGLPGSYVHYGPGWAAASATPFRGVKGSAQEGALRVPFILAGADGVPSGTKVDAFAFVTDVAPTILELAGVAAPEGSHGDRKILAMDGKSMLGFLRGEERAIHGPGQSAATELAGSAAVFRYGFKLVRNHRPFGDGKWRLYRLIEDPTEANDLSEAEPQALTNMLADYARYVGESGLVEVPEDYDPVAQLESALKQAAEATPASAATPAP